MENDEVVQNNTSLKWLFIFLFMLMACGTIGIVVEQYVKSNAVSNERMYLACLDKLVNPEHSEYTAQLIACKVVKE